MPKNSEKTVALIIDIDKTIIKEKNKYIEFCFDVFSSLIALSEDNRYQLYLYANKDIEQTLVDYVHKTLVNQKVVIEEVLDKNSDLSFIDKEFSYLISADATNLSKQLDLKPLLLENWLERIEFLLEDSTKNRTAAIQRKTGETEIELKLDLDGKGDGVINSGLPFLDHMLHQITRHGKVDLDLTCKGDLIVDEHHTVEDIAIVLGEAFREALGDKRGIKRYGFELLPMDEVLATVALDFSGRSYFEWDVEFGLPMVGTFPTELFEHFFKTFSDLSRSNLHIKVTKGNTHHQIEAIFKAFARAVSKAIFRYKGSDDLPSTKGLL